MPRRNTIDQGAFVRDSIHTLSAYLPTKHKNKRLIPEQSTHATKIKNHFLIVVTLLILKRFAWSVTPDWEPLNFQHHFIGDVALLPFRPI